MSTAHGCSRRDFVALACAAASAIALRPFSATAGAAARGDISITHAVRVDLLRALNRDLDRNVLKLFAMAADASRNRLYVAGIMSQYIAVLDGDTHAAVATIDTGLTGSSIKYLALDEAANRLYVRDTTNQQLLAMDLNTGGRIGPVALPGVAGDMVVDANRGRLFLPGQDALGLRALDGASLTTVFSSATFSSTVASLAADPAGDALYGLESTRGVGRIYRMALADQSITTISYGLPATATARTLRWSPADRRFFVAVPGLGVLVVSMAGEIERSLSWPSGDFMGMSLDARRGRLFVNFLEAPAAGEVAGTGSHLWAYDGRDWRESAVFGKKPYGVICNQATGRFYAPAGDESMVWWGEATATTASGKRIGDSVEGVVIGANGTVYMNSRLGGSHLVALEPATQAASSFSAGVWPVAMCLDAAGTSMVVLNAWDSTLSMFELPSRRLLSTIPIGLAPGTTDRLPDLAVDFSRGRAYVACPEFAACAVVDIRNGRALEPLALSGITGGDTGGGPNQVEVAVSEAAGRLLVYCGAARRLSAYDISEAVPRLVAETETPPPSGDERLAWKVLFIDPPRERAFVGPAVFDVRTGRAIGMRIGKGQKVFASDDVRDLYWTTTVENETIAVHTLDRSSLSALDTEMLGPADHFAPVLALDAARGRLYVSHLTTAAVDCLTLG
jgi:DNA-binding beta-propeller fold protein YncE